MKLFILCAMISLQNSLLVANPINGGLTRKDFDNGNNLPEEYKQQPEGQWLIDNNDEDDQVVAYNVPRNKYRKWPKARVPYKIDGAYNSTEKAVIAKAIKNIQSKTCVRFVRRTTQRDYIFITPDYANGFNCYSDVGRQGRKQLVKMQGNCVRESAMTHELIHAIGFGHENQRPDARKYIEILRENIKDAYYVRAYKPYSASQFSTQNKPYDFYSIMHYPDYAYVKKPGLKSMRPKAPYEDVDLSKERVTITAADSEKINYYYGCKKGK